MERCTRFSHICGENVRISEGRYKASWDQRYSGGIFFSDQPLRPSDPKLRLQLDGSSHVDIGVTQTDPNSFRGPEQVRQLYLSDRCSIINNIRVHRKACEVFVQNLGNKVVSPYGDKTFGVSIDSKQDVWLVVCIKFGNATVNIDPPSKFHEVTGENVEIEGTSKHTAKLKVSNPAAICVIDREFTAKDNPVRVRIDPMLSNDGNPPHLYHITLGATTAKPEELATLDPQSLSISKLPGRRSQSRWSPINVFERRNDRSGDFSSVINNCEGELTIEVTSEGELRYRHTSGTEGKWAMKGSPLFIVLELFRVSVKVVEVQRKSSVYANQQKGPNAYHLVLPTSPSIPARKNPSPTEHSCSLPVKVGDYISPVEDPPPLPFPSQSSPCESSWHDWPTDVYTSYVLKRISSLEADAVEELPQNFERKMADTITEMRKITLKGDSIPAIATENPYLTMNQPTDDLQNPAFLPSGTTMHSSNVMLNKINSKMDHLEKTISQLKNVEKEHHDKMYAGYKALKEIVVEITEQSTASDVVSMASTIQANYTDLLRELEPRELIFRLFENGMIDWQEKKVLVEMRTKGCSKEDQNDELLDYLGIRPVSRSVMIEALEYSKQSDLKDKMLPYKPYPALTPRPYQKQTIEVHEKHMLVGIQVKECSKKDKNGKLLEYLVEKEVGHTKENAQSMSSTYGEGEAGMSLLPELDYEDNEGSAKFIKAVQEGNLAVLQEFDAYFKSKGFDFKHFPVNPLIIIAVFGSPEAVEHVQSWSSTTFNWNDQPEIPVGVFEGLLDEMKDRKATPLYVATFLKKPVIVESLIKYSDEQNIAYCMNNIQLSNPMEIFFMAEVGERLKKEYRELKPSVVPGHQREANGRLARVFIVYSPKVVHVTNHIKDGIGLVMIRNPYRVDDEAMTVSNSKEVDGDISKQDMERTNKAIESHSKTLWCNHSNLNIISVCTVRSKRKGGALEKCLCVVLYCSTKGVVPLGEKEFPSTLALGEDDSIDIDVREGYFEFGGYPTKPSTNHHDKLKMGCNIGALPSQNGGGTLGPFVQYKGTMGFLTCAHVLFDDAHQHSVDFTDNGSNQRLVVQPATDASSRSGNPCGFVHRVIFNPSMDISIDVAVVTISDETRRPNKGRFANDHSYKYREAGFDDLPEYNNGAILPDIKKFGTSNFVVKFGSETHLTKGYLRVDGAQVRPLSTALGLPSMKAKFYMKNQYEIIGDKSGINIFQPGDSGSAVFMLEGTSLHCIGLAIGRTTYGTAVVTPIQAILAALGSDADIEIQRFNEL